ncbi:MAG: hypothetical protein B6D64_01100 [Bacteroidetes bacterium 4484_276]|nr:MAG: hypothetical protein B6D64_01100 [Bacteroidetes bacterium 4484_276]
MYRLIKILSRLAHLICVITFFYVANFSPANAQNPHGHLFKTLTSLDDYTGEVYGTDDFVVNGRKYLPEHYNAKGNPYFLSDNWTKSTLIIDGKRYDGQDILYNIDVEKIILKTTIKDSIVVFVMLNNEFVSSIYFGPRYFINAEKCGLENKFPGFVEQVYSGSFTLLVRHQKSFVSEYSRNTPNGFYSETKSINYIFINGQLHKLPTKRSMLEYFSVHKKEVKTFMRKNKIRYKQAGYAQLHKLFEYCDKISSN